MIGVLIVALLVLWFFGYLHFAQLPIHNVTLFQINAHIVSLWDALIFLVIVWALTVVPPPLRHVAGVLLVLWVLSTLGIIAIGGLSSLLIIAIIVGLVYSVIG